RCGAAHVARGSGSVRSEAERAQPGAPVDGRFSRTSAQRVKRRILLADDDQALRRLISTTLGTEDFELFQARDGEEALSLARSEHPELVLLDINMPKLDGFEVCSELRATPETAAIKVV